MTASPKFIIEAATSEVLAAGRTGAIATFFAQDYVAHVTDQELRGGHDLVRSVVAMYHTAFSSLSAEVLVFLESADTVAWRRTMRGTQTGPFKGFPATELPIVWQEMVVTRVSANRIAEEWIVTDLAERLLLGRKSLSRQSPASPRPRGRRGEA
jgi:predicted ester cyclase